MPLKITVPVTLVKDENFGFYIECKAKDGDRINARPDNIGWAEAIFDKWANEKLTEALLSKRRNTGLKDRLGRDVFEGDIVEGLFPHSIAPARAVVKWAPNYAAFVMEGRFKNGGEWGTENLSEISFYQVVGNVIENPNEFHPAQGL